MSSSQGIRKETGKGRGRRQMTVFVLFGPQTNATALRHSYSHSNHTLRYITLMPHTLLCARFYRTCIFQLGIEEDDVLDAHLQQVCSHTHLRFIPVVNYARFGDCAVGWRWSYQEPCITSTCCVLMGERKCTASSLVCFLQLSPAADVTDGGWTSRSLRRFILLTFLVARVAMPCISSLYILCSFGVCLI